LAHLACREVTQTGCAFRRRRTFDPGDFLRERRGVFGREDRSTDRRARLTEALGLRDGAQVGAINQIMTRQKEGAAIGLG